MLGSRARREPRSTGDPGRSTAVTGLASGRLLLLIGLTAALGAAGPVSAQETTDDAQEAPTLDAATFGALRARPIGPAVMSGRIAALDAVDGERLTIWVGAAGGGVWKSEDGGVTFQPVFDEHTQSIGAIAVDPSHPDTVWVGTGESWTRNSVSVGTGLYRTGDGGESWELVGLEDSERIARVVVDPADSDRVFVCVTGHLWNPGGERGVYRTTDGGESWEAVLTVDGDTGCSDLGMDPQEPGILYAGMWQFRRLPWTFTSGGPGSGLYRSTDGGDGWEELTEGLPEGEKGRIAVAVAPSRPSRVYALVEAEKTALYRSDDLGRSWEEVNASANIQGRPFYFAHLAVDPTDHDRVYKGGFSLGASNDGGRSFSDPFTAFTGAACSFDLHPDVHAIWISPRDPRLVLAGTDGGLYISHDRCGHWRHARSLPISQFYEASVDLAWPYHVYGGLQDNGSWSGPSRAIGGIRNEDWRNLGYGDGFHAFVDPGDPDYVYAEWQGGNLLRVRKSTGETKQIRPYAGEGEAELRFNWNAPLHLSPSEPGTIYVGAQYLFRSRDRGDSWERISPDLTTDDPGKQRQEESGGLTIDNTTAENHTTIYTIAESPLSRDVLWVGTDDGNLQVSRDGGSSWENVVANVPDLPANTWVSHVEASPHGEGAALVTFDGHRTGDMATYAYRTDDSGRTWRSLATDDLEGYAHVVKQDPVNSDLLFLGTEFGLFISVDGGASWARFESGFPPVAVRDLAIHPREHDLVIATHGRGIWILDDVTPLRNLTAEVLASEAAILPSRPAVMVTPASEQSFAGDGEFIAPNPPEAASVVYYLKRRPLFGDLRVDVYDAAGERVSSIPGGRFRGLNRVDWRMRLPPPKVPRANTLLPSAIGPRVPEGTYTVRLVKGEETYEGQISLVPDPRSPHPESDRRLQQETALELYDMLESLAYRVDVAIGLRDAAGQRAEAAGGGLASRLEAYADELDAFHAGVVVTDEAGRMAGKEKLRERLGALYGAVVGYDGRPTASQLERMAALATDLEAAEARFAGLTVDRLNGLQRALSERGLEPLPFPTREEWRER